MTQKRPVALRTCIGCREKKKKEDMIWLVQSEKGVIRVDRKKSHWGRGFYLCPDPQCLKMAKERKRLSSRDDDGISISFVQRFFKDQSGATEGGKE